MARVLQRPRVETGAVDPDAVAREDAEKPLSAAFRKGRAEGENLGIAVPPEYGASTVDYQPHPHKATAQDLANFGLPIGENCVMVTLASQISVGPYYYGPGRVPVRRYQLDEALRIDSSQKAGRRTEKVMSRTVIDGGFLG